MSKKRKQRARARQVQKARQGSVNKTRRKSSSGNELSSQTMRWLKGMFWGVIGLLLVGLVAVLFYYAVWRPNMERLNEPPPAQEEGLLPRLETNPRDNPTVQEGEPHGRDQAVAQGPQDGPQAGCGLSSDLAYREG